MALTKASFAMISGATINALDYGAVGDGSTDNTAAFAAAVAALAAQGGGILYIPKGTYKYTLFLVDSSNITVRGDGIGATVLRPQGWIDGIRFAKGYPVPTTILYNVGIQDITMDGADQLAGANDTYGNGINVNGCAVASVKFCEVKNFKQQGIVNTWFATAAAPLQRQEGIWITDNYVDASAAFQICIGTEGLSHNSIISRNIVRNVNSPTGVGIYAGAIAVSFPETTAIISDNIVEADNQAIGIKVEEGLQEVIVTSNKVTGGYTALSLGYALTPGQTTNYLIADNKLVGWASAAFQGNVVSGNSKTIFSGNNIVSSASTTWAAVFANNYFISSNRFEVGTAKAIWLVGDGTVVNGNYIVGATVNSIDASGSTGSVITGNYVNSAINRASDTVTANNVGEPDTNWNYGWIGPKKNLSNPNGNLAPASGTWAVGDKVWNTTPTAAGYVGWVCVTAGTPGTWKEFGEIAA